MRMCGRYVLRTPAHLVQKLFLEPGVELSPEGRALFAAPRYNIAPTQSVPALRIARETHEREIVGMRWGLIPFWAKDRAIGSRMINARTETVDEKPAFRDSLKRRRCVLIADGFYEWEKRGKTRVPFLFEPDTQGPVAFAGLWDRNGTGDDVVTSCTILTTTASDVVARIHDRMPLVVPFDLLASWLDPHVEDPALAQLLERAASSTMKSTELTTWVNSVAHDDAQCVAPAAQAMLPIRDVDV
jgi:putative SOS response-associated peptidase YedK